MRFALALSLLSAIFAIAAPILPEEGLIIASSEDLTVPETRAVNIQRDQDAADDLAAADDIEADAQVEGADSTDAMLKGKGRPKMWWMNPQGTSPCEGRVIKGVVHIKRTHGYGWPLKTDQLRIYDCIAGFAIKGNQDPKFEQYRRATLDYYAEWWPKHSESRWVEPLWKPELYSDTIGVGPDDPEWKNGISKRPE